MAVLINSPKQQFALCSIQSGLREVDLYSGEIDGLFGEASYQGFEKILGEGVERTGNWVARDVIFNLQRAMVKKGLDTRGVDGVWGEYSEYSFQQLLTNYRRANKLTTYSYAWSKEKNVTDTGIASIEKWMDKWDKPKEHTSFLLSCIAFETAGTFSPSIENPVSKAIGLIQFMPVLIKRWGISAKEMGSLSFDSQLDYVFKYFEEYKYIAKCQYLEDYYLSIFYPKYVGRNPDDIIAHRGTGTYTQNKSFDKDNKGYYTVTDVASPVLEKYWTGMSPKNRLPGTTMKFEDDYGY